MLLSTLLLPAIIYGKNNDVRIKELEEAQFKKELEISELSAKIHHQYELLDCYRANALYEWNFLQKEKPVKKIENSFDECLASFKSTFDVTKDVKKKLKEQYSDMSEDLFYALIRVIVEKSFIDKLAIKYMTLIQELADINQKIIQLKK